MRKRYSQRDGQIRAIFKKYTNFFIGVGCENNINSLCLFLLMSRTDISSRRQLLSDPRNLPTIVICLMGMFRPKHKRKHV